MAMMREEPFGPVAPFQAFTRIDDAVAAANATPYGLCAYLFTRDLARTVHLSERLEAGTVCVNHVAVNTAYGPYADDFPTAQHKLGPFDPIRAKIKELAAQATAR